MYGSWPGFEANERRALGANALNEATRVAWSPEDHHAMLTGCSPHRLGCDVRTTESAGVRVLFRSSRVMICRKNGVGLVAIIMKM